MVLRRLTWLLIFLLLLSGCAGQKRPQTPVGGQEPVLKVYMHRAGVIREMKMEDYLLGVVAGEMDPDWPVEALAAQAILARTFTLKQMETKGGVPARGADASTDEQEFQAYDSDKINDRVKQAVAMTRGMVIRHQGRYVHAFYHADSGGRTATAAEGLEFRDEPTPYLQGVDDPGTQVTAAENKAWTVRIPVEEVRKAVRQRTGADPGPLGPGSVQIVEKGPSGRAVQVKVGKVALSGPAFRLALGSERVRSTLWEGVSVAGGRLVVKGRGFGHGVGMSQYGAKKLAMEGKSPQQIIAHFFQGVQVERAWQQ